MSSPLPLHSVPRFIHHVELQGQSARLLSGLLAKALGLRITSHLRTSHGVSYTLQSGQAMIVCTAALPPACDLEPMGEGSGFHRETIAATPTTVVRSIAFQVAQPDALAQRALKDGRAEARAALQPNLGIEVRMPALLGDITLRFLDGPLAPNDAAPSGVPLGIPGFAPIGTGAAEPAAPGGIIAIDHVAMNVPEVRSVVEPLEALLGWTHFRTFEENRLQRPLSAVTIASETAEGLLTIVQPTSKRSVFRRALAATGGASVHHIALRCGDVIRFVHHLASKDRWNSMPPPPADYYDAIRPTALEFIDADEFELLRRYGMLLDAAGDCALIQVFLPYLDDAPGLFFELIGRVPRRNRRGAAEVAPGCGGFGDGNVSRLYDCLVQAIDAPPG